MIKYSDYFMSSLKDMGFTTCFYVGGGNSMHLLESASRFFNCVPVVHEVTAAISAEYFNQVSADRKAFALVTAGPGFTNLVTGIAGAWLDSRELLVVGGQAKSTNLARGAVRQIGHQEVDGIGIATPITKKAIRIEEPMPDSFIKKVVSTSWDQRPGPVFIEVCLDVSAAPVNFEREAEPDQEKSTSRSESLQHSIDLTLKALAESKRPLLLLGGGVSKRIANSIQTAFASAKIPIASTWTGADRASSDYPYYAGRPNTYGMRWANIFLQQADLLIAVGTSLGFQQTGFNTRDFLPEGKIIHVDIDQGEINKSNPKKRIGLVEDSEEFLLELAGQVNNSNLIREDWIIFLDELRKLLPTLEECQLGDGNYLSPHEVINAVSRISDPDDYFVAASSGGTFTAVMQVLETKKDQILLGNKGLASMGYGLAGAIGLGISNPGQRVILFEGDGGFAQNMQDLGTVVAQNLNLKIFITDNDGYASIRTSQKNYFEGHYLGCDSATGLILPDWEKLFDAFGISSTILDRNSLNSEEYLQAFNKIGSHAFIVKANPEQMYLPKIFSRISEDGSMESTALHDMSPAVSLNIQSKVFPYLRKEYVPNSK